MIPTLMITTPSGAYRCVDLRVAAGDALSRMPYVHRILLENVLRQDDPALAAAGRDAILAWLKTGRSEAEIPFSPTRILMHDTTCGPALADIAAMRDALAEAGGDPDLLNPAVPVATSTDHSAPVDYFGTRDAARRNLEREFQRNGERYQFMKWATNAIDGFRVFRPAPASCTRSIWSGSLRSCPRSNATGLTGACRTRWSARIATRPWSTP